MSKWALWVLVLSPLVLSPSAARAQSAEDDDDIPAAPNPPPGQRVPPYSPQQQYPYSPQPGQYPQQPRPQYPQQQPPPPQYTPPGYQSPPSQYNPPGYQQPQQQPPPNGYHPPAPYTPPGYPQYAPQRDAYGRPMAPPPSAATPPPPPAITPAQVTLELSTASAAGKAAALACADALDNFHLDLARQKCTEAIAADDNLALAHLWLAQAAATPEQSIAELGKAVDRFSKASPGERALVGAMKAWRDARIADAQRGYDEAVLALGAEKRAFVARGQFRQVALGDVTGAIADYRKAVALDGKYAAGYNFLGFALADAGKLDEAAQAIAKYAELAPNEPNAHDSLAALALRRADLAEAASEEKKALSIDPRFLVAHATLGDVLLFQGRGKDARREYEFLIASTDGATHHDGALRSARSFFFEGAGAEAELALVKEADNCRKAHRLLDAAETFVEAARAEIERGALAEAGRGLKEAQETLKPNHVAPTAMGAVPPPPPSPLSAIAIDALDRARVTALITEARALSLGAFGERALAEARADELAAQLRLLGDAQAEPRARVLRGWIAWKSGDDAVASANLDKAALPTMRYAYAMALARTNDLARARVIMEELARRDANDLETALARPRAQAWLKAATATAAR